MACSSDGKVFTSKELTDLSANVKSPKDVLDILMTHKDRTEATLNNESYNKENRLKILHVLSKASKCRTNSEKIINLLSLARYSWFMKVGLTTLIRITGDNGRLCDAIHKSVELIGELSIRLRSVVFETMGLLILLKDTIDTILPDLQPPLQKDMLETSQAVADLQDEAMKIWTTNNDTKSTNPRTKKNTDMDDMEPPDDFRKIPILPSLKDIFLNSRVFLRINKAKGKYNDLHHYLDVQFRLYREDCISGLRDGIKEYVSEKSANRDVKRLQDGRLYKKVTARVVDKSVEGLQMEIKLNKEQSSRIQWRNSQRLIYGSLVCLSDDHFQTMIFAVVAESDRMKLDKNGTFTVHMATRQKCPVGVFLTMVESTAYFEAYKHVLSGLQNIQDGDLPFEKYIVHCSNDVDPPNYLQGRSVVYDLHPNIAKETICKRRRPQPFRYRGRNARFTNENDRQHVRNVDILASKEDWPSPEELHLDESQFRAFHSALTEEFVLIQGPPGTGKTYVGLQIAKALLHNDSKWRNKRKQDDNEGSCPMLVVCMTNHALDQFVEGIIDFHDDSDSQEWKDGIVRVGGRSQSEKIEPYSLKYKRRYGGRHVVDENSFLRRMERIRIEIALASRRIRKVNSSVLGLSYLREYLNDANVEYFQRISEERMVNERTVVGRIDKKLYENIVIAYWLNVSEDGWTQRALEKLQYEILDQYGDLNYSPADEVCTEETIDIPTEAQIAEDDRRIEEDDMNFEARLPDENIDVDIQNLIRQILLSYNGQHIREDLKVLMKKEATESLSRLTSKDKMSITEAQAHMDLHSMPLDERWRLYRYWVHLFCDGQRAQIEALKEQEKSIYKEYQREKQEKDASVLKRSKVIAMTTTGAARYHDVFREVGPRIIIVEEAAEVLEAHIITCLSAKCEHLILIGDHKQLEPKPSVYELEIKYNLGVSMFERMLNNGLSFHCLQRQHRMRPEISYLLRHIYPNLVDNDNVKEYEKVLGVTENLFFITHKEPELFKDGLRSYSNEHEAIYIKRLCSYLLMQGYKPSQITVLAAYNGQMFCIRNHMPKDKFEGVKISAIDNYQGEENDIILVSLVRSNENRNIGFLKKENRVCVALSRARKGMYIIGNSSIMQQSSSIWQKIIQDLILAKRHHTLLPLYCQIHPDHKTMARTGSDFDKVPEGGCGMKCDFRLPCGHACRLYCHPRDREHIEYRCKAVCRKTCPNDHTCKRDCHFTTDCNCPVIMNKTLPCKHKCNMPCSEDPDLVRCMVLVSHILEPCGHEAKIQCYLDPEEYDCKVKVTRELPRCDHTADMECYKDPHVFECQIIVTRMLTCGHEATMECFKEPDGFRCPILVNRTLKCGHNAEMECHIDAITYKCKVLVTHKRQCGHSYELECFKSSVIFEMHNKCIDMVTKTWEFGHSTEIECCNKDRSCEFLCLKTCTNGHKCVKQCHHPLKCKCETVIPKLMPGCDHEKQMPCFVNPADEICETMVLKKFPICQHEIEMKCYKDISTRSCKTIVKKKFPNCKHTMDLRCFDDISRYACITEVVKKLPCSHEKEMKCCDSVSEVKCDTLVEKHFPVCKHAIQLKCFEDINRQICQSKVVKKLPCSHEKKMKCCDSVIKAKCDTLVEKQFPVCKHTIQLKCFDDISRHICRSEVLKRLPCTHEKKMKCCDPVNDVKCDEIVEKIMPECGHLKKLYCQESTAGKVCRKTVMKTLPKCGHSVEMMCYDTDLEAKKCKQVVLKSLPKCGHEIKVSCCDDINTVKCTTNVTITLPDCGHRVKGKCFQDPSIESNVKNVRLPVCRDKINKVLPCKHTRTVECTFRGEMKCLSRCTKELSCGHTCTGLCTECFESGLHAPCKMSCDKTQICGHSCQSLTCGECKPCQQQCEVYCPHSKCYLKCSEPCHPCLEPCQWSCPHFKCTRTCSELCDRAICEEPCPKELTCGHPCLGLCGEPCPRTCRICDTEQLKDIIGIQDISTLDVHLVVLLECHHEFVVEVLDGLFDSLTVNRFPVHPRCPKCSKLIQYHPRYGNLLKRRSREQMYVKSLLHSDECHYPIVKHNFQEMMKYIDICCTFMYPQQRLIKEEEVELRSLSLSTISELSRVLILLKTVFKEQLREQTIQDGYSLIYNLAASWIMFIASNNLKVPQVQDSTSVSEQREITDGERAIRDARQIFQEFPTQTPQSVKQIETILRPHVHDTGLLEAALCHPVFEGLVGIHIEDWNVCQTGHVEPSANHRRICMQCDMGRPPKFRTETLQKPAALSENANEKGAGRPFLRDLQNKPLPMENPKEQAAKNIPTKYTEPPVNIRSSKSSKNCYRKESDEHGAEDGLSRRKGDKGTSNRETTGSSAESKRTPVSTKDPNTQSDRKPSSEQRNMVSIPISRKGPDNETKTKSYSLNRNTDKNKRRDNDREQRDEREGGRREGRDEGTTTKNNLAAHTWTRQKNGEVKGDSVFNDPDQSHDDYRLNGGKEQMDRKRGRRKRGGRGRDPGVASKRDPTSHKELIREGAHSMDYNPDPNHENRNEPQADRGQGGRGRGRGQRGGRGRYLGVTARKDTVSHREQNRDGDSSIDRHSDQRHENGSDPQANKGQRDRGQRGGRGRDLGATAKRDISSNKDPIRDGANTMNLFPDQRNEKDNDPNADRGPRGLGSGGGQRGGRGRDPGATAKRDISSNKDPIRDGANTMNLFPDPRNEIDNDPNADRGQRGRGSGGGQRSGRGQDLRGPSKRDATSHSEPHRDEKNNYPQVDRQQSGRGQRGGRGPENGTDQSRWYGDAPRGGKGKNGERGRGRVFRSTRRR